LEEKLKADLLLRGKLKTSKKRDTSQTVFATNGYRRKFRRNAEK